MNALASRVNSLRRKMALELAVVRLRQLAQEFCLLWTVALSDRRPSPDSHPFFRRVVKAGFRLPTFMAVHKYLNRCRSQNTIPDGDVLLRSFLPWSATLGFVNTPANTPPQQSWAASYNTVV